MLRAWREMIQRGWKVAVSHHTFPLSVFFHPPPILCNWEVISIGHLYNIYHTYNIYKYIYSRDGLIKWVNVDVRVSHGKDWWEIYVYTFGAWETEEASHNDLKHRIETNLIENRVNTIKLLYSLIVLIISTKQFDFPPKTTHFCKLTPFGLYDNISHHLTSRILGSRLYWGWLKGQEASWRNKNDKLSSPAHFIARTQGESYIIHLSLVQNNLISWFENFKLGGYVGKPKVDMSYLSIGRGDWGKK